MPKTIKVISKALPLLLIAMLALSGCGLERVGDAVRSPARESQGGETGNATTDAGRTTGGGSETPAGTGEGDLSSFLNNLTDDLTKGADHADDYLGPYAQAFIDTLKMSRYHIEMQLKGEGVDTFMEWFYEGGMMAILLEINNLLARMVVKNNNVYVIFDSLMMMQVTEGSGDEYAIENTIGTTDLIFEGTGSDSFAGRTMQYEKYGAPDGSMQYYFGDAGGLKGIRSVDLDGNRLDMQIVLIDQHIPGDVFDIPDDYAEF